MSKPSPKVRRGAGRSCGTWHCEGTEHAKEASWLMVLLLSGVIKMNRNINRLGMMATMLKHEASIAFFFALTLSSKLFASCACGSEDSLMSS